MTTIQIDLCPACGKPCHATEGTEDGYHPTCTRLPLGERVACSLIGGVTAHARCLRRSLEFRTPSREELERHVEYLLDEVRSARKALGMEALP